MLSDWTAFCSHNNLLEDSSCMAFWLIKLFMWGNFSRRKLGGKTTEDPATTMQGLYKENHYKPINPELTTSKWPINVSQKVRITFLWESHMDLNSFFSVAWNKLKWATYKHIISNILSSSKLSRPVPANDYDIDKEEQITLTKIFDLNVPLKNSLVASAKCSH